MMMMMEFVLQIYLDYTTAKRDCGVTNSPLLLLPLPGITGINQGKSNRESQVTQHTCVRA